MKYVYPAVFEKEDGGYSISFPDLENCYTSAETLEEGIEMANDVLCMVLYHMEEDRTHIPAASDISKVQCGENAFVTLIACDTVEYRRYYDNKAVKKTLSIPSWLNTMAERQDINFSSVLQKALKAELGIS